MSEMPPYSKPAPSADDSNLTTLDWVLCILCSLIGCILGIVYMIQGKPKGLKMIGISILFAIIWNVISYVVQRAQA